MTLFYDFIFHIDDWLNHMILLYPIAVYILFFSILFLESACFPLAPFLPGDGLLFGIGVAAMGSGVNLIIALPILILGGVFGNMIAYWLGKRFGTSIFQKVSWLNESHYTQANVFYQQHGDKAFILSRFLPVVRALVPFIAGVADMSRFKFMKNNILSVCLWVLSITLVGYFLGHIPIVKNYFGVFILGLVGVSLMGVFSSFFLRIWKNKKS